jgi:MHS family proline/betaine transporter-like MFS transporter
MGLFGGTTPLIAAWLIQVTNNLVAPAYWLLTGAGISLITLVFLVPKGNVTHV